MGAALNGMVISKVRAFGGTFFNFTDYMRPSMRLASIMEIPTIYVLTHDSIGLGEDGPTHQPIEQLASLRAMPHMIVMRPGDANEVVEAWKAIMLMKRNPVALVLTRQALPTIDRTKYAPASGVAKGGYILADAQGGKPQVILIGTGSELSLCVSAHEKLTAEGVRTRANDVAHQEGPSAPTHGDTPYGAVTVDLVYTQGARSGTPQRFGNKITELR